METTPTLAIIEYEPIAAALASVEKYRGLVCDVTTPKGMAEAKAAHREVAALRIALDKTRKKVKEDVLARGKLIDGEANRIFAMIAAIEDPIKSQIDAEEQRAERERVAAIDAEQVRLAAEEAARKKAEEEKLASERAEIARREAALRVEQERQEEEARARRAALAAEEAAARQRIEEQNRAAYALREEEDRKARVARQAEEDRLRAEREKIDAARREEEERQRKVREEAEAKAAAERRATEEAERQAREKREAVEREEKRKATELLDAQGVLDSFVKRFGHLPQFAKVVKAIEALRVAA